MGKWSFSMRFFTIVSFLLFSGVFNFPQSLFANCEFVIEQGGATLSFSVDAIKGPGAGDSAQLIYVFNDQRYSVDIGKIDIDDFIKEIGFSLSLEGKKFNDEQCPILTSFFYDMVNKTGQAVRVTDERFSSALHENITDYAHKKYNAMIDRRFYKRDMPAEEIQELIKTEFSSLGKYQMTQTKTAFIYDFFNALYGSFFEKLKVLTSLQEYEKTLNEFKDIIKQLELNRKKFSFNVPLYIPNLTHIQLGEVNRGNLLGRHIIDARDLTYPYLKNNKNEVLSTQLNTVEPIPKETVKSKIVAIFPVGLEKAAIYKFLQHPDNILAEYGNYILAQLHNFHVLLIKDENNPFVIKTAYPLLEFINMERLSDKDRIDVDLVCHQSEKVKLSFKQSFTKQELSSLIAACDVPQKITASFNGKGDLVNIGRCLKQAILHKKRFSENKLLYQKISKACPGIEDNIYALHSSSCQPGAAD